MIKYRNDPLGFLVCVGGWVGFACTLGGISVCQFVLYKDKRLLALPHYTEFVQTVSKGVGIISTFYSLHFLQMPWTGLEGCQMGRVCFEHINIGFIRNHMQL